MAAARYVAIPSVGEETASLAALEALAAARPLLVSERGALPELVATGAGVVSRPGDEIDISDKISLLMEDDELCRRASTEALTLRTSVARPRAPSCQPRISLQRAHRVGGRWAYGRKKDAAQPTAADTAV